MTNTEDLETLRALRKEGRLIPFVGAGLSSPLGLPSWAKLMDNIARQLGYDPEVFKLHGNHLQLAEYYVAVRGSIGPLAARWTACSTPSTTTSRLPGAIQHWSK